VIDPGDFHRCDADIFARCPLGGVLNENTIPELRAPIVCGVANNQLLDDDGDAQRLQDRGVLYAPDYIVNAGVSSTRFTSWMETTIATPQRLRRRRSSTRAGW
ncbi:MAG TPA: hypothetical protein QGF35_06720, partial [Dehalococcoidia bacterium]|nr:hypothetical protein [Dehalococcoidia bacterium]